MRLACELGKFPEEIAGHYTMDDLQQWAGYFRLQHEGSEPERKPADDIEASLFKALGPPGT